jgi:hypothetical protein
MTPTTPAELEAARFPYRQCGHRRGPFACNREEGHERGDVEPETHVAIGVGDKVVATWTQEQP